MPFTENYIVLKAPDNGKKFVRVYYPDNEDGEKFSEDLDTVLDEAQHYALKGYTKSLPSSVIFSIAHTPETALSEEFVAILRKEGFEADSSTANLDSISFLLSWEIDSRLRALQERLQKEVYIAHPASIYDVGELVAEHNANVLKAALQATHGIALDYSLASLEQLDQLITMGQSEDEWRFHVFSESLLIAVGDYTGEVMRKLIPGMRWTKEDRPLEVQGATFVPRSKAFKLCVYGSNDSLASLVRVAQMMEKEGRF